MAETQFLVWFNEFSKLEFGKEYDKINVETVAFDTAILN